MTRCDRGPEEAGAGQGAARYWAGLGAEVLLLGWTGWALQHYFRLLGFVDLFRQMIGGG